MLIRVLGSAAGGGFPQWNCNCPNCAGVRAGKPGLRARTQSSLAVSRDGGDWVLLNASPDLRKQIEDSPVLAPAADDALRSSPIKAAVLTNGDVDHIIGLINLREMQPLTVYASDRILSVLGENSVFNVLSASCVERRGLPLDRATEICGRDGSTGLTIEPFAVPGKVALYLENESAGPGFGTREGDTIGLKVTDTDSGSHFFYIPGCAKLDEQLTARLTGAPLVFFDGTLYTDHEMIELGLSSKTGQRMGHISISGPDGSIAGFASLNVARKIYVHINNSNPVLDETSKAHRAVVDAGWEVGFDGMEVSL
jgi:pyrroloquinoline quinone biosynthesis protein B